MLVLGLLAVTAFISFGVRGASQVDFVVKGAQLLRLPVASINNTPILYSEYISDLRALQVYSRSQGQEQVLSEQDYSDRALSRLIVNALIKQVAKEYKIEISPEEIQAERDTFAAQFPDAQTLEAQLAQNFGWDMDTFVNHVIVPTLREQKLAEAVQKTPLSEGDPLALEQIHARHILFKVDDEKDELAVEKNAKSVLKRIQNGESFESLAKEFGSDSTKEEGGDLGWFGKGQMVPEFETAVFSMEVPSLSSTLVRTAFGFHIVEVLEKRVTPNFSTFMDRKLAEADIRLYADIHNPFEGLFDTAPTTTLSAVKDETES